MMRQLGLEWDEARYVAVFFSSELKGELDRAFRVLRAENPNLEWQTFLSNIPKESMFGFLLSIEKKLTKFLGLYNYEEDGNK